MTDAARLLDWGFAMDGKVTPVGTLVSPQPPRVAAPVRRKPQAPLAARPLPAGRGVPLAAGAAAVLLAALIGGSAAVVSRRRPRGGSRPAP
jgi:serine-type D-Ala-D-Ala carboxypeptidase (penicillin-binding protein 5/6)